MQFPALIFKLSASMITDLYLFMNRSLMRSSLASGSFGLAGCMPIVNCLICQASLVYRSALSLRCLEISAPYGLPEYFQFAKAFIIPSSLRGSRHPDKMHPQAANPGNCLSVLSIPCASSQCPASDQDRLSKRTCSLPSKVCLSV